MPTENISPRYLELDSWSTAEMIAAMYEGQLVAAAAVRSALGAITAAVEEAVPALQQGGRIRLRRRRHLWPYWSAGWDGAPANLQLAR